MLLLFCIKEAKVHCFLSSRIPNFVIDTQLSLQQKMSICYLGLPCTKQALKKQHYIINLNLLWM